MLCRTDKSPTWRSDFWLNSYELINQHYHSSALVAISKISLLSAWACRRLFQQRKQGFDKLNPTSVLFLRWLRVSSNGIGSLKRAIIWWMIPIIDIESKHLSGKESKFWGHSKLNLCAFFACVWALPQRVARPFLLMPEQGYSAVSSLPVYYTFLTENAF